MYETMVKEAYENIIGMDKEAENHLTHLFPGNTAEAKGTGKMAGFGKRYLDALKASDLRDVVSQRKAIAEALPGADKADIAKTIAAQGQGAGAVAKAGAKTLAAYAPIAAGVIGTGVLAKKMHDKKKAQRAQAALEAAGEQKTAAENDYMEACAYEEAALEVLAKLGFDIDAFEKEASEVEDAGMSAEEMDEAAFNYLAERGYFDGIDE